MRASGDALLGGRRPGVGTPGPLTNFAASPLGIQRKICELTIWAGPFART
jgi:hypothetical protein